MNWLSDTTVEHLRLLTELPDLEGTRYRLVRELGRGGMGIVYLADDTVLKRQVALKVLSTPLMSSPMVEQMLREATVIAQLEHPSIVPVHDAGTLRDGRVFYVMKLVRGESLAQGVEKLSSTADRLGIFLKACEAVSFAHANGVIHRDLKPENIMLGPFGEVLVMDWGTVKLMRPDLLDKSERNDSVMQSEQGLVIGTPAYMSPEQAQGHAQVDERTDIYSLGAVLQFLLNAGPLWERSTLIAPESAGKKPSSIGLPFQKNVPRPLVAICRKAMAGDPAQRYQNAKDLAADISRFLDGQSVSAYQENIFEKLGRWATRHRFLILLILAYLLMRIIFLLAAQT